MYLLRYKGLFKNAIKILKSLCLLPKTLKRVKLLHNTIVQFFFNAEIQKNTAEILLQRIKAEKQVTNNSLYGKKSLREKNSC